MIGIVRRAGLAVMVAFAAATAATAAETGKAVDHSAFDRVLRAVVREEKVDYQAVRDAHRGELKAYLDSLARVVPDGLPREEQLALYINLYNASMIAAVVDRYTPWYIVTEKKSVIFSEPLVRVAGKTVSLDDVEHRTIRPVFKDPRAHAALVCAGLSCPPLQPRAFRGVDLDTELDRCMREWLNSPKHNRVDHEKKRLTLSKIFLWYADDFGGKNELAAYVSKYLGRDVSDYTVGFFQYDFRLNDTATEGRPEAVKPAGNVGD